MSSDKERGLPSENNNPDRLQRRVWAKAMRRLVYHPAYLLGITISAIFISEALIMLFLPPLTPGKAALLDAVLLTVFVFPMLYLFLLRPVRLLIRRQKELIDELREALSKIRALSGMLPICSHCKKIRNDKGYWQRIEVYIREHSEAEFTHGLCPDCAKKLYPEYLGEKKGKD